MRLRRSASSAAPMLAWDENKASSQPREKHRKAPGINHQQPITGQSSAELPLRRSLSDAAFAFARPRIAAENVPPASRHPSKNESKEWDNVMTVLATANGAAKAGAIHFVEKGLGADRAQGASIAELEARISHGKMREEKLAQKLLREKRRPPPMRPQAAQETPYTSAAASTKPPAVRSHREPPRPPHQQALPHSRPPPPPPKPPRTAPPKPHARPPPPPPPPRTAPVLSMHGPIVLQTFGRSSLHDEAPQQQRPPQQLTRQQLTEQLITNPSLRLLTNVPSCCRYMHSGPQTLGLATRSRSSASYTLND